MYKIVFTKRAFRDLKKLNKNVQHKIAVTLKTCAHNPTHYAVPLRDQRLGSFRLRVGEYRVIFDLEDDMIVVLRVGHRKSIYR